MQKKTLKFTLIFGVVTGLVFPLVLWGYEAYIMAKAHVGYWWLTPSLGIIFCILLFTLAAFLAYKIGYSVISVILWILVARATAELTTFIPLRVSPWLIKLFDAGLRSRLPDYPINETFQVWVVISFVCLAIFFGAIGLLQLTLVEQAAHAPVPASRLSPFLISVPVMVIAGMLVANLVNEQLRLPLVSTDASIQFAIDNMDQEVDWATARAMHMGSVRQISDLLDRPRRLFLGTYDEFYEQVQVLIDLDGTWAACTTIAGQPTYCRPLEEP